MQSLSHRHALRPGQTAPVVAVLPIHARRDPAGPGRRTVADRPVDVFVNDLFAGHGGAPLGFFEAVLSQTSRQVAFDRRSVLNGGAA